MKVAIHDALPPPAKGRDGKVKHEPFDIGTGLHGSEDAIQGIKCRPFNMGASLSRQDQTVRSVLGAQERGVDERDIQRSEAQTIQKGSRLGGVKPVGSDRTGSGARRASRAPWANPESGLRP